MADKFSGRVYAGEDSEDDEEEEEIQYSFQYGGFSASQSSASSSVSTPAFSLPAAPRFSVQAPVAVGGGEGSDEDEDDSGREEQSAFSLSTASTGKSITVPTSAAANGEESEEDDSEIDDDSAREKRVRADLGEVQLEDNKQLRITTSENVDVPSPLPSATKAAPSPVPIKAAAVTTAKPQKQKIEDDHVHWQLDGSIGDGVQVMGDAIVSRLQPSLDDSIHRIAELAESQEHLLHLLSAQNASICSSEQIKKVAVVMDKLPHYIRKIQDIKAAMTEISTSVEKMKRRAENLRVDAQSHAIKKENKRDSMSQWNKLHAAKSAELAANGSTSAE